MLIRVTSAVVPIPLAEDEKLNRVRQLLRHIGGYTAAKKIGESNSLGRTDDKVVHAHGCRKIDNRGRTAVPETFFRIR